MAKVSKKTKKEENKKNEKYNADNEIIIGVTTKPREKVRVEKDATRTVHKNKKTNNNKQIKEAKDTKKKIRCKKKGINNKTKTEAEIKRINRKKILISTTVLFFLILCGTIYYLTTPVFNISNIIVYGNEKNSTETYISLTQLTINETNIFAFTKKRNRK